MTSGNPKYMGGVWASSLRHRPSNDKWYWVGCINFYTSYVYTADSVTGPWTQSASIPGICWYDCGLLIDDDDTMYIVYGHTNISISQLAPDGLSIMKDEYMFGGSSSSIWGPWKYKYLQTGTYAPFLSGGIPDQDSLVEGPDGRWYFLSFLWNFTAGRIPCLIPLEWGADGYPTLVTVDNQWGTSYSYPTKRPSITPPMTGSDYFKGSKLGVQWQWVLNPDNTKFKVDDGLILHPATVTDDIYLAANTLTHRTYGAPGLAAFSYMSARIEISRAGDIYSVSMVSNATQDANNNWATISDGTVECTIPLDRQKITATKYSHGVNTTDNILGIWLRVDMNTLPASPKEAKFS
ncbi:glycosyl hydrolase [Xylariaceae sp. FL0255]|nr:glycosyl hydrolase [Xylariaceae sp. FL0255]